MSSKASGAKTTMPNQTWDAGLYDNKHAFVWQYGASLVGLLAPKSGERILDLGCGTGHLTSQIAESGAQVVGLDHSAEMLAQARSAIPELEFVQGDARDFTFAQPFDAVFSNAVLHWIRPPEAVIRCVYDALRPGGRFTAEFGGRGNVRRVLGVLRETAERMGLSARFTRFVLPEFVRIYDSVGGGRPGSALGAAVRPADAARGRRRFARLGENVPRVNAGVDPGGAARGIPVSGGRSGPA